MCNSLLFFLYCYLKSFQCFFKRRKLVLAAADEMSKAFREILIIRFFVNIKKLNYLFENMCKKGNFLRNDILRFYGHQGDCT